ncbi:MAG: phosphate ABC transporter permease PstA [Candidatus Bathyarchaeia archaeon]
MPLDRMLEEKLFKVLMQASTALIVGGLLSIVAVVLVKGAPALSLQMLTETPKGGYYQGKGGGILNAIVGSLYLAGGATALAMTISLPTALYLNEYGARSRFAVFTRNSLDMLWSIPSIIYGVIGFIVMIYLGIGSSLLGGIMALTLLELPIMIRAMDEVLRTVPLRLKEASYALGATRLETAVKVALRQALPGLVMAIMLALGRAMGDAASVLFTAGYTDSLPSSIFDPVASLPLAVFFQLGTPFPEVQQRAYASGFVLLAIILSLSIGSRLLTRGFNRFVVK